MTTMMMRTSLLLGAGLCCLACIAQEASAPTGAWVLKFRSLNGRDIEAKIVFADNAGTFKLTGRLNREDPCSSIEAPIVLSKLTSDGFEMAIKRSQALTGCQDATLTLKRVDASNYEGKLADGRPVAMVKQ